MLFLTEILGAEVIDVRQHRVGAVRDLTVRVQEPYPVVTGLVSVNEKLIGRMPLFRLTLPAGITLPLTPTGGRIILKNVGVSLDSGAASTLNSVFHVSAFQGGSAIGTARVIIHLADDNDADQD